MSVSNFANEVDKHVGQRLRERRETLRISQGRLGRHLGLTFSQIQKYEKGSNRVGAGRLYQIATFLGVAPNYFFDGLKSDSSPANSLTSTPTPVDPEELKALVDAFSSISDADTRASVLALVRSLNMSTGRNSIAR